MEQTKTIDEAVNAGYVITQGTGKSAWAVANELYNLACKTDIPYVRIEPKRQYAQVIMDLVGNSYQLTSEGIDKIWQAIEDAVLSPRKQEASVGPVVCRYDKVPIENASVLARQFFEVACEPANRESKYL